MVPERLPRSLFAVAFVEAGVNAEHVAGFVLESCHDFIASSYEPAWHDPVPGVGRRHVGDWGFDAPPGWEDEPVGAFPVDDLFLPTELDFVALIVQCFPPRVVQRT